MLLMGFENYVHAFVLLTIKVIKEAVPPTRVKVIF